MPLNREQIRERSQKARRTVDVPVPALGEGETIRLRQMAGGAVVEYDALVNKLRGTDQEGDLAFTLLQNCGVDEENNPLWEGEEGAKDVRELPPEVLGDLATAATELHKVSDATVEAAAGN